MSNPVLAYEVYFMNVPFCNDYKHIVYFGKGSSGRTKQFNAFKSIAKYHYDKLNIIVKNSSFIIKGSTHNFDDCNYMMYKSQNDDRWYFAFIDEVLYNSYRGTRIIHTLDVWQTYHTGANFTDCFIERGHIKSSDDDIGRWLAPEPIGFGADFETEQDIFTNISFEPKLCIESLSLPEMKQVLVHYPALMSVDTGGGTVSFRSAENKNMVAVKYYYGGVGTGVEISGKYRIIPEDAYLNKLLSMWQAPEYLDEMREVSPISSSEWNDLITQNVNHMGDIISFSFIPQFILGGTTPTTNQIIYANNGSSVTVGRYMTQSLPRSFTSGASIDYTHLGCYINVTEGGTTRQVRFKPNNKKMFTSLARAFKIYNKNGLSVPLRPELIDGDTAQIKVECHTFGNELKLSITNYNDLRNNFINIPYSYSFQYGINNNVGIAQATRVTAYNIERAMASLGYVSKGIGIASQIGANVAMGSFSQNMPVSNPMASARQAYMADQTSIGMANPISSAFDLGANIVETDFNLDIEKTNAYKAQTFNIGNTNGDRIEVKEDYMKLRFAECNPTYYECQIIDMFLDRYGYSILEWMDLNYFLTSRNHWNYIKTREARINTDSPNDDNVTFNNIFNAGTTVWHSIDDVGNYNQSNT